MAVKGGRMRHEHKSDSDEEHLETSDRLAPLEETEAFEHSSQRDGGGTSDTIRVDNASVRMPEHFAAEERDAAATFRLHPVVVVILALMLAFIGFIAWQVSLMPAPQK